ncbi:uncharacterized protein LOC123225122 [Mangifera indica]|uniref:uncharacterized protein LOC123225122 n=1 Tax=Mangifera indica TaxID=29780 RepID=UPI001CF958EB|nr:uncharacterized protein LOC123225122 [Mangifera indica]
MLELRIKKRKRATDKYFYEMMFGGGRSMGGGGGGGGMLRTVGRAVTRTGVTNLQEPISSSSSNSSTTSTTAPTSPRRTSQNRLNSPNHLSLSAVTSPSPFSPHNVPVSAAYGAPTWPSFGCEDYEWVSVDGGDERSHGVFLDDFVVGPVPSLDEVNNAVSALQQGFDPDSYSLVRDKYAYNLDKDAELDWVEPSLHLSNSRALQPYGPDRVYDAFHLLQNDPSIQRMVVSLSSDQAVWNAVLNNEVVQELKESFCAAAEDGELECSSDSCDDPNPAMNIIKWIFHNTRAKVIEVIDKITHIVNELFKPSDAETPTTGSKSAGAMDPFEEKLRTSFLLSIIVLLVVVVTRAGRASP